jgi:energy-coupling factor transporter ATP-binding protein EcfA2
MSEKPSPPKVRVGLSEDKLPAVEIYFDGRDGSYWFRVNGRFCQLKKSDLALHLKQMGYSEFPSQKVPGLSVIEVPYYDAQMKRMIAFSGPLAGHKTGTFVDGSGKKYLVTEQAEGVFDEYKKPKLATEPKWFLNFLTQLLPDGQDDWLIRWLKIALVSLRTGDFRPGQVIVLAGQAGCGKSLLQNIITQILGGRVSDPFRYMMGQTQFNRDLCAAEHWQIQDPPTTTDMRTRRLFGSYLKEATVNREFSIHAKGKDALYVPIFRRITISVNDEPENLAVVPPMDPSIEDKIFLFRCARAEVGSDREEIWARVLSEIHQIRFWLLTDKNLSIPKEHRDDRFGVKAWHHPELMEELTALSAENRLLQIIDQVLYDGEGPHGSKTVKAIELEHSLRESKFGFACEKLLSYSGACGSHLGKLSKSHPKRIQKHVKDGTSFWTIQPPSFEPTKVV